MKIALVSNTFPSEKEPFYTKFILDHVSLISELSNTDVVTYIPTPYAIPFTKKWIKAKSKLQRIENVRIKKFRYLSIPRKKFPAITRYFLSNALIKYLSDAKFDLIHFHWLYPASLAVPLIKKAGFKCILTIHGSDWYKNKSNDLLMNLLKESLQSLDWIFFVSPEMRKNAVEMYPFLKNKSSYLPNTIDSKLYSLPTEKQKSQKKEYLGWNNKKIHFLCVAAHKKVKGVDILLKAAKRIEKIKPDIHIHLIGSSNSGNVKINYTDYKNVTFHKPVAPDSLVDFYHAADGYISPSRVEGFGLALTEAATTGLPVVATSTGIATEIINRSTGLLCKTRSVKELTVSIIQLSENLKKFEPEIIREQILKRYSRDIIKQKMLKRYQEVLKT